MADTGPGSDYLLDTILRNPGDLMVGLGGGVAGVHPVNQAGFILFSMPNSPYGTGLMWLPFDAVRASLLKHKGDLITTDGHGNIVIIGVGGAGDVLMPNPDVPGGLEWVNYAVVCPLILDFSYTCDSQYIPAVL